MEQQPGQQGGVPGPAGRRLHIAHRRSPSEMTPMIMEQLALQQQIEFLQQQQQQIAATHQQYVNMGMIPQQQQLTNMTFPNQQGQQGQQGMGFQFPQQQQQQQQGLASPLGQGGTQQAHRRNQSALPGVGSMGPPPAPSSGAAGQGYDYNQPGSAGGNNNQARDGQSHRGGRGGGQSGGGHQRRHSLALPEAKKAAELAQQKRGGTGFQFPIPGAGGASPASGGGQSLSPGDGEKTPDTGASGGLSARSGNSRGGGGHGRSQSMATGNGRGGGQGRGNPAFQFPPPMATNDAGAGGHSEHARGGHARTSSRNFEGNWRQPNTQQPQTPDQQQQLQQQQQQQQQQQPQPQQQPMGSFSSQNPNPAAASFQPGHRGRASMNQSMGSIGAFQFPNQGQMMQNQQGGMMMPQMFNQQQFGPMQLNQLQALQAAQLSGQTFGLAASQHAPGQMGMGQPQQQQQRKTLFTPYLPQASLPALLADGQLVSGILRVNKKNRSDAYVTSTDLDADIFICGSKDRNRALEGDFVAIELLDVDEVWSQKREKEEKKKRKDITDSRISNATSTDRKDGSGDQPAEGGIRRRGSLRQRPTQKKNDDVEVEGQSLLLMEEEEISDEQKPLYAGHVVAVIDRIAGQMFSGTLGLLRPSSQATKEKQEAERQSREGGPSRHQDRHQEKPKIVWFKPTDKRVPLIAIPTEQAPRDFVERHQDYANRIFVACIKRWPITSLHPFGTLVEQLGEMGDLKVETDALLRDNNFGPDEFSDAVLKNVGFDDWSIENESEEAISARRDLRGVKTFTIDPNGSEELEDAIHVKKVDDKGTYEVGVHVSDAAHFVKPNSLVDREAKKRGTGVHLINRVVKMLPPRLATDLCSLVPGQARYTVSVVFHVDINNGKVIPDTTWIGKSIINSSGRLSYDEVDAVIAGKNVTLNGASATDIKTLKTITDKFRAARFDSIVEEVPSLRLISQLDDENVPVEHNIFVTTPAHEIIEEMSLKANAFVAERIAAALPEKALLRRHAFPKQNRLQTFAERMTKVGYAIDTSSSATLQSSLFKVQDSDMRKGMETLLIKTMQRAKYVVAGKTAPDALPHFAFNLPLYTHFTNPTRRYADVVVHRQLEAALSDGAIEFNEDMDALVKTIDQCNTKKDSAQSAQEQSVHIDSCRLMDKKRLQQGGNLISEGIVICVYESAFDVLIPEYGFEKRVHCDQLPLKKAEFRKETRVLELYWEKGVASAAYVPEDERPKAGAGAGRQAAREKEEAQRKQMDTGTMSTDDVDALFDDDDDGVGELNEHMSGVALNPSDRDTQSVPHSPSRGGSKADDLHRTQSESNFKRSGGAKMSEERLLKMFKLREEGGEYIQDVTEMTRVPVILRTDLSKSPPCLTIRSINPYAL